MQVVVLWDLCRFSAFKRIVADRGGHKVLAFACEAKVDEETGVLISISQNSTTITTTAMSSGSSSPGI